MRSVERNYEYLRGGLKKYTSNCKFDKITNGIHGYEEDISFNEIAVITKNISNQFERSGQTRKVLLGWGHEIRVSNFHTSKDHARSCLLVNRSHDILISTKDVKFVGKFHKCCRRIKTLQLHSQTSMDCLENMLVIMQAMTAPSI